MVNKEYIKNILKKIGLKEGDTIFVHSSLKSFGKVDGGADTVIDAILETVLPDGNVMMPTFTGNEKLSFLNPPVFDIKKSKCWTGIIPETFRKRKETIRSWHPTHSVAVIGKDAEYIVSCHHVCQTPCGVNTPYDKLVKMKGYILMVGVDLESTTHFHYIEEIMESKYHLQSNWVEATILNDNKLIEKVTIKIHSYSTPRKFTKAEDYLKNNGAIKYGECGNSIFRLIDAQRFTELMIKKLKEDPDYLLLFR